MHTKILLHISLLVLVYNFSFSQTLVRGKIIDEKGEPLTGASVIIKGTTIGTMSDFDGNYSIKLTDTEPVVIEVHFISYNTIEENIIPGYEKIIIRNYILQPASMDLQEVTVTKKMDRSSENIMRIARINSTVAMDYISVETIKKTGDSQVDDALKRVTGVSTVGGYITVRGLADRYNVTTINGSRIPTLDPLKNNIKLDMFPTALIDNIIINKSLSPDLPGDWSGSYVSVSTKDYPEELILSVKTSFGYNNQSSFKKVVSSQRSSTDWLGYDNGFRDIEHPDKDEFPYYTEKTNPYDEFMVLGLEDYYNNLGVTSDNFTLNYPASQHSYDNNIYYQLGLMQLNLLSRGDIGNSEAVYIATEKYFNNPELKDRAFLMLNSSCSDFAKSMPENWMTTMHSTSLDFSQDFNIGNQVLLFGKPLGFLIGARYSSSFSYDPETYFEKGNFGDTSRLVREFYTIDKYDRKQSKETNRWSLLSKIAYKLSPNHSLSFMFMPNFTGINTCTLDSGINVAKDGEGFLYTKHHNQKYEERQQLIYQFQSKHFIPGPDLKIELNASYTQGQSNIPDFRSFEYGLMDFETTSYFAFSPGEIPVRRYRYLVDNIFDSQVSVEIPFQKKSGLSRNIKLGASYMENLRVYKQYIYYVFGNFDLSDTYNTEQEISAYVNHSTFEEIKYRDQEGNGTFNTHQLIHYYAPEYSVSDFSKGYKKISSAYAMIDYNVSEKLRFAGGLRVEYLDIYADVLDFYNKNIPDDDSLRYVKTTGEIPGFFANSANRNELHYLPSLNIIYKPFDLNWGNFNIRLGYGKSLGYPTLREISNYLEDNIELDAKVQGNPLLKSVNIDNYDIRLESYFKNGDNISLGGFYKEFDNHIEFQVITNSFSWSNAPGKSKAYGVELEGKKIIIRNLDFTGNVAYIYSRAIVPIYNTNMATGEKTIIEIVKREMYGQPPYIINAILTYTIDKAGFSTSVSYNTQGPRLVYVTTSTIQPDVYEMPRNLIDIKISKDIGKNFSTELKIRDLLGTRISWAYDFNDFDKEYRGYNYGTSYTIGISYKL